MQDARLYVGNLNYATTEDELREHFAEAGEIAELKIIRDRDTQASKGFGFVEFDSVDAAKKAIADLHEMELSGRKLTVTFAKPREPKTQRPPQGEHGRSSHDRHVRDDHRRRDDSRGRGRRDDY